MRPIFRFTKHPRAYFVGGCRVPSLHEVLDAAGRTNGYGNPEAMERGSVIHELALAFDEGNLDVVRLVSPVRGWILAHAAFVAEKRPRYDVLEQPYLVNDAASGILLGTRVDRAGYLGGAMVTDLKSGGPADWHRLQTVCHVLALDQDWRSHRRRYIEYLKADGSYRLVEHVDRRDFDELRRVWGEALCQKPELQKLVSAARTALRRQPLRCSSGRPNGRLRSPARTSRSAVR